MFYPILSGCLDDNYDGICAFVTRSLSYCIYTRVKLERVHVTNTNTFKGVILNLIELR